MTERIQKMAQKVLEESIYPAPVQISYNREDLLLSKV